ncbi:hypothetical protein F4804DRAFT_339405 [Jackrogersella minutella]|nr:hypothetical protein F4804DRAFT_339405 [Jackrogersella minutella]
MEKIFFNSLNLGILVEKEIVVHVEEKVNGDSTSSHPPSARSFPHFISDLSREMSTSEPREMAESLPSGKMLARPNVSKFRHKDLVEFLHGPPPRGNFMSIPDNFSVSSAEGKWSLFKVFRKRRKRRKRRPPLIRLPDSAVSARTIGGHRHISISIPTNYADYEFVPSQLLTIQSVAAENKAADLTRAPTSGPRRNTFNPVSEDHESFSSSSLATRSGTHQDTITELAPPPGKVSLLSTVPSHASQEDSPPNKGKELDRSNRLEGGTARQALISPFISDKTSYITERESQPPETGQQSQIERQGKEPESEGFKVEEVSRVVEVTATKQTRPAQTENEPVARVITIEPKSKPRKVSESHGNPRIPSANLPSTLALPVRTSSRRATMAISGRNEPGNAASRWSTLRNDGGSGHATGPRGSFTESLMTTESSPRLLKAQTATAYQSVPIVVRPPSSHPEVESPLELNFPTPPSNRASHSAQADFLSPPTVSKGTSSRRERVRERKIRDIEKLKTQLRKVQTSTAHLLRPGILAEDSSSEPPALGQFSQDPGPKKYLKAKTSEIGPIRSDLHLKLPSLSSEAVLKKRRGRSSSAPAVTSSSSPSSLEPPSISREGTTSYYRRRERQAEREENEARARREQYAAQVLMEEEEAQDRLSRQQLLRQYEKLKESRTKDMEKRLHRLERNGEVLMQSLVSVMETLNRLLQDQQHLQRSFSAHYATTSAPRPHRKNRGSAPGRAQSLRSAGSYDPPKTLHVVERRVETTEGEGETKEASGEVSTRVSQSALEALQEHLQSQPQEGIQDPAHSSVSSNDHSIEAGSLEVMEPLMRELQDTARLPESGEREDEGRTPVTETELFNLF